MQTPTSTANILRRLRLFNEKTEKLLRCSFVQKVFSKRTGLTIRMGVDQPLTIERSGADEEATDALTLTLRLFFMRRDGIALEQMWEISLLSKTGQTCDESN